MDTIPFIVSVSEAHGQTDTKGLFRYTSEAILQRVPVEHLKQNLSQVSGALMTVLEDIQAVGRFRLREVTLQVEVTAEGGVELIGTAAVGGKGAITLKFEGAEATNG